MFRYCATLLPISRPADRRIAPQHFLPSVAVVPSSTAMSLENSSQKEYKDPETVVVQDAENVYRPDVDTSGIDERKLMRRIDWHVVPWLAVLYLLNFLDRGNIGNAKVRSSLQ